MKVMQCKDGTWSVYWICAGEWAHIPGVPWVKTEKEALRYYLDLRPYTNIDNDNVQEISY